MFEKLEHLRDFIRRAGPQIRDNLNKVVEMLDEVAKVIAIIAVFADGRTPAPAAGAGAEEGEEGFSEGIDLTTPDGVAAAETRLLAVRDQFTYLKKGSMAGDAPARPVSSIGPEWDQIASGLVVKAIDIALNTVRQKRAGLPR